MGASPFSVGSWWRRHSPSPKTFPLATVATGLCCMMLLSGCATYTGRLSGDAKVACVPYGPTSLDLYGMAHKPAFFLDLPFSLIVDTAFLPVDLTALALGKAH